MLGSTLRIALRNLGRSRRRTALALAAIAVAQMAVLSIDGVMNARTSWTIDALTGPVMGHVQVHAEGWREDQAPDLVIEDIGARLDAIRALPDVGSAYARIYAPALAAREVDGHAVLVIGIDPAEAEEGGLIEGLDAAQIPRDHSVLVGSALARDAGIEVGDELAILGQAADGTLANDILTVTGILRSPAEIVNQSGVLVSLDVAQEIFAMPDMAHEITVRGSGQGDVAPPLAEHIRALPEITGLEVMDWRALAPEMVAALAQGDATTFVVLVIVFIAAAAGVTNTMLMATFERRRELGMLLSLGTTPGRLIRMILVEAVALGLGGVLLGSVLGGLVVLWMGSVGIPITSGSEDLSFFGVTFNDLLHPYLEAGDYLPGIVGTSVVAVLAALWPALLTARLEPMEAMRS